jgi:hypothetical protein
LDAKGFFFSAIDQQPLLAVALLFRRAKIGKLKSSGGNVNFANGQTY